MKSILKNPRDILIKKGIFYGNIQVGSLDLKKLHKAAIISIIKFF